MIVGVPRETKDSEFRVAVTPGAVCELTGAGHQVWVETRAGAGSGFSDEEYQVAGARIVPTPADAWSAKMVIKVKEPQPSEYDFMGPHVVLFTYLHLAAEEQLTREMLARQRNPSNHCVLGRGPTSELGYAMVNWENIA